MMSGCLEFEACRYNGARIPFDLKKELAPHVRLVPICPEVEIGLGVPRDPIRLVRSGAGEEPRLVQPSTGRDLTGAMEAFSARFLAGLDEVDGFILKSRSPSCGTAGVKVYADAEGTSPVEHRPGAFAERVLETFPWAAIGEEGRLSNDRLRDHFLTKLFALARLRRAAASGAMRELVRFHASHKLLLMAYHETRMRELGRVVANHEGRAFGELVERYREGLARALRRPARAPAVVNVLDHAFGYVSDGLSSREKRRYERERERYRDGRIPLGAVGALLFAWGVRFGESCALGQAFFQPYPEALMSVSDSGKGRLGR